MENISAIDLATLSPEQRFHYHFAKYGGRCPAPPEPSLWSDLKPAFGNLVQRVKQLHPNLPFINFDVILNLTLNGVASKNLDEYFIGMNMGSIFLFMDIFRKMVLRNDVLTQFKNSNSPYNNDLIVNLFQTEGLPTFGLSGYKVEGEMDDKMKFLSNCLTAMAMEFLIHHEICHVLRGHVDYGLSQNKSLLFENQSKDNSIPFLTHQTLEMDADSFAVNRALNNFNEDLKIGRSTWLGETFRFGSWQTAIYLFSFSVYTKFRLFGFQNDNLEGIKKSTHPSPAMRLNMIGSNIITIFKERTTSEFSLEISEIVTSAAKDAEIAFSKVTNLEIKWDTFKNSFSGETQEYIWEIRKNWNTIRSELEKYTYSELPPLHSD
jgi:hypothetical protein